MTVEVSKLGRVRIIDETAINVSEIASIADFIDVPIVEDSAQFTGIQPHDEPGVMQTHVHGYRSSKMVAGVRSCTLDFTTYLAGSGNMWTGTTLTAIPSDDARSLGRLLKTMMGGSASVTLGSANTACTVESTGTTTRQIVMKTNTIDTGSPYVGLGFACVMPSGRIEAREIRSYAGGVIVPTMAFSDVPAEDSLIYFGRTYHLVSGYNGFLSTLQAVCQSTLTNQAEHLAMGLQGTFGIDVGTAAIAKLTVKLLGGGWSRQPTALALSAPSAYTAFQPLTNMSSELLIGKAKTRATWTRSTVTCTVASTAHGLASGDTITLTDSNDITATPLGDEVITVTGVDAFTFACVNAGITAGGTLTYTATMLRNVVSHSSSTWQPGVANLPVTSPEGLADTNLIGWVRGRSRAITGSFTAYGEPSITSAITADNVSSWEEADSNQIDLAIQQQIGMTTKGIVLISAPTTQINAVPTRADASGLYGIVVNWSGRNDLNDEDETANTSDSALRITVF